MKKNIIFILFTTLIFTSCDNQNTPKTSTINANTEIASYTDGIITKIDIEHYLTKLPAESRWAANNPKQWYKDLINKIIVGKQIIKEAKLASIENSENYIFKQREILRAAYSSQYLSEFNEKIDLSENDIKNYYDEHIDRFQLSEQRTVYHIFINSMNNKNAKKIISELRNRTIAGESFQILAEKFSDSETRHKKGLLGTVSRGVMSEDFDSVVFALDKNQPSEVIKSSEGYHVFYVTDILAKKDYSYESLKNMLYKELIENKTYDYIKEKALAITETKVINIPNVQQLNQIQKQPQAIIMEIGDFQLKKAQLINWTNENHKFFPTKTRTEIINKYLQDTAYREVIYQYMLENQIKLMQSNTADFQLEQLMIKEFSKEKIRAHINKHPELIKQFYSKNKMRFSSAIKLNIEKLIISRKNDVNLMPELEDAVLALDKNELSLNDIAEKYDGKSIELGLKSLMTLTQYDPQATKFAVLLNINEHSAPYTNKGFYFIVKLLEKTEAQVKPLSIVREQVIVEYIKTNAAFVFNEISKDILANVKINETNLDALIIGLQEQYQY